MTRLGGADEVSIRLLEGWPHGLFYRPDAPAGDHTQELIEKHFRDGSSVFHDGDAYERYFVQRVRNYAHIGTLLAAGIWRARSTGECHAVREISVERAASWVQYFKSLTQEEYAVKVFGEDYGFPPFRVGCSCRMEGIIAGVDNPDEFTKNQTF